MFKIDPKSNKNTNSVTSLKGKSSALNTNVHPTVQLEDHRADLKQTENSLCPDLLKVTTVEPEGGGDMKVILNKRSDEQMSSALSRTSQTILRAERPSRKSISVSIRSESYLKNDHDKTLQEETQ